MRVLPQELSCINFITSRLVLAWFLPGSLPLALNFFSNLLCKLCAISSVIDIGARILICPHRLFGNRFKKYVNCHWLGSQSGMMRGFKAARYLGHTNFLRIERASLTWACHVGLCIGVCGASLSFVFLYLSGICMSAVERRYV